MKMLTVCGPPSSGKTSVIIKTLEILQGRGMVTGVVKMDCLATFDDVVYREKGIGVQVGLSESLCPDHYLVSNIEECHNWGLKKGLEMLIVESAGLCNRCSPHVEGVYAVCVLDNLMGVNTPQKIGPMLEFADLVVITKGDIVSPAEREVFAFKVRQVNPSAVIMHVNGITGQGAFRLADFFSRAVEMESLGGRRLRYAMPSALCSYCLGEVYIGEEFQMGSGRKIDLNEG